MVMLTYRILLSLFCQCYIVLMVNITKYLMQLILGEIKQELKGTQMYRCEMRVKVCIHNVCNSFDIYFHIFHEL